MTGARNGNRTQSKNKPDDLIERKRQREKTKRNDRQSDDDEEEDDVPSPAGGNRRVSAKTSNNNSPGGVSLASPPAPHNTAVVQQMTPTNGCSVSTQGNSGSVYATVTPATKQAMVELTRVQDTQTYKAIVVSKVKEVVWRICKLPDHNSQDGARMKSWFRKQLNLNDQDFENIWNQKENGVRSQVNNTLRTQRGYVLQQMKCGYYCENKNSMTSVTHWANQSHRRCCCLLPGSSPHPFCCFVILSHPPAAARSSLPAVC